jgi:hypothetical protein
MTRASIENEYYVIFRVNFTGILGKNKMEKGRCHQKRRYRGSRINHFLRNLLHNKVQYLKIL